MEAYVGAAAFLLTLVIQLPQAVKVVRTHQTRDLSILTYVLLMITAGLWIAHGIIRGDLAVWTANIMVLLLSAIILGYKLKFG
ncbi:MAG TPA: SemiSWEET family transporter [Candidatus Saccharimonadia bacterium]